MVITHPSISDPPGPEYKLILVTGDRNYSKWMIIENALLDMKAKYGHIIVIHGDANGADSLTQRICEEMSISTYRYPAQWDLYGKAAGPLRNTYMLDNHPEITEVLAFHDYLQNSKGTLDCVTKAIEKGLKVTIYENGTTREMQQIPLPLEPDVVYDTRS